MIFTKNVDFFHVSVEKEILNSVEGEPTSFNTSISILVDSTKYFFIFYYTVIGPPSVWVIENLYK